MKPVVVKATTPQQPRLKNRDAQVQFENRVFDSATMFTAAGYRGRGTRYRAVFQTPQEAMQHARETPRTCVYAANEAGRQIVLDRALWPQWLERWEARRS